MGWQEEADDAHNNACIAEHAPVSGPGSQVGVRQSRAKTRSEEQGGAV